MTYKERYDRNIGVWDEEFQEKLKNTTIGIAGVGGTGCCPVEVLARNGFGRFKIADPDIYERSNIQRQLFATEETIGKNKTLVAERKIKLINPEAIITSYKQGLNEKNLDDFLEGCDFVHEVMDYFLPELKIIFHRKAREKRIIVTTTGLLGTGICTIVFHPEKMSFEEYLEYPGNPEGWGLPIDKFMIRDPDYLDKKFYLERLEQQIAPATADGAFLAGCSIAGIYKRLLMGKEVAYAPNVFRVDFLDDEMYWKQIMGDENGR